MSITVSPDPAHPAGHALVRIAGAAGAVNAPGFRLQREEDWEDNKLGPGGWQSSDVLLTPDRAETAGADLLLHVGWAVCRHLEAGVYTLEVPATGQDPAAVFWPDIVPMHAGARDVITPVSAPEPVSAPSLPVKPPQAKPAAVAIPAAEPARPAPVIPPSPPPASPVIPPSPKPARSRMLLPGLLALVLIAAGAGYYAWTHRGAAPVIEAETTPAPTPPPVPTPPAPPPQPPPSPPPLDLGRLSVPDVLTQAPNPAAITAEGTRRLGGDRHDDGLLLLEAAADRGDGGAAAALARLYDPVLFQPGGPIPKPDPRQAARYYRDAARTGADVSAPREALRHQLEDRARSGDLGANLSLKDFWP